MIRRKLFAVTMALFLGAGLAACGTDDSGTRTTGDEGGPGQSTEEDPTLGDDEGGGTDDSSADEDTSSTDDGADEGTPANGVTDSGSGTGEGRGDG